MKKRKIRKVEKKIWKFFLKKKRKKKGKVIKKKGEESLWITVVIHGDLGVGEQWFPDTIDIVIII